MNDGKLTDGYRRILQYARLGDDYVSFVLCPRMHGGGKRAKQPEMNESFLLEPNHADTQLVKDSLNEINGVWNIDRWGNFFLRDVFSTTDLMNLGEHLKGGTMASKAVTLLATMTNYTTIEDRVFHSRTVCFSFTNGSFFIH